MGLGRKYPVFTDGKKFYHSSGEFPKDCRFGYWSGYDLKEWEKKEKKLCTKEKAKSIWDDWEKRRKME